MSENKQMTQAQFQEKIQKNSGLIIATGILLLLMGMFAMGSPLAAGLSLSMMVGITLIIGGIGQLAFAFKAGNGISSFVLGALTVAIGGYMFGHPGTVLESLTLFLAIYLVISGIFEAMMYFQIRPVKGWGFAMISGILSIMLGIMIWKQFPLSGVWAVGILIGVRLFFNGMTLLMLGLGARQSS